MARPSLHLHRSSLPPSPAPLHAISSSSGHWRHAKPKIASAPPCACICLGFRVQGLGIDIARPKIASPMPCACMCVCARAVYKYSYVYI